MPELSFDSPRSRFPERRFFTLDHHRTYQSCDVLDHDGITWTVRADDGTVLNLPNGSVVELPRFLVR